MSSPAACPACEGPLRPWRRATASDPGPVRPFYELVRCETCGTAVTVDPPTPAQAAGLYEGGTYAPTRGAADLLLEPLRRLIDADRMRRLRGLPRGARVLELGAGDGRFVKRMRRAGLRARGAEPSPAARRAALALGVELEAADPLAEPRPGERGAEDAIVIWHVLEHLPDPAGTLTRARSALAPAGRLVVAVPNLASLQARIGGDRWFGQDVPRHRTHFTPRGLRALLSRSGFAPARLSHFDLEQNPLGMWQTALNRVTVERDLAFRLLKRDVSLRARRTKLDLALILALGPPMAVLAPLLELAAGLVRRGGSIVAVTGPARP